MSHKQTQAFQIRFDHLLPETTYCSFEFAGLDDQYIFD